MAANKKMASMMFSGLDVQVKDKNIIINTEEPEAIKEAPKEPKVPRAPKAKKTVGRPRKFTEDVKTVFVNVQLLEEEEKFLQKYGGEFGGKTGYIRKLIQQEMARVINR